MIASEEFNYRLYNGDSLELLKQIPDNSVDLVVTDPPYRTISGGQDKVTNKWMGSILEKNDGKIFAENDVNHREWLKLCWQKLKNDSHIYIMTNLLNLFELKSIAEEIGFQLHNLLIWEKNNSVLNRWYMKNCEYTLFMRKGEAKVINDLGSKTVEMYPNPTDKRHPTEKPVALMERYIGNSSNAKDIVLDPFMGSGTTGVASINLGRRFIGMELDKQYFDIACERIKNETKQMTLF